MAEGYRYQPPKKEDSANNIQDDSTLLNDQNLVNWSYYHNHENEYSLDLSYLNLDGMTLHHNLEIFKNPEDKEEEHIKSKRDVHYMYIQHNRLDFIPENVCKFRNLKHIDLSNNFLTEINEAVFELKMLTILVARNNFFNDFSLPKKLGYLQNLEELNLSGNLFKTVPPEIIDIKSLKSLYMGSNQLEDIPRDIWKLEK